MQLKASVHEYTYIKMYVDVLMMSIIQYFRYITYIRESNMNHDSLWYGLEGDMLSSWMLANVGHYTASVPGLLHNNEAFHSLRSPISAPSPLHTHTHTTYSLTATSSSHCPLPSSLLSAPLLLTSLSHSLTGFVRQSLESAYRKI